MKELNPRTKEFQYNENLTRDETIESLAFVQSNLACGTLTRLEAYYYIVDILKLFMRDPKIEKKINSVQLVMTYAKDMR